MTGEGRPRRTATVGLVWAALVLAAGVLLAELQTRPAHVAPTASRPTATATTAAPKPSSTSVVVSGSPPPVEAAPATPTAAAGALIVPAPEDPSSDTTAPAAPPSTRTAPSSGQVSAPAVAVTCHPDLPLEASPDAPYSFLCASGTTPVSWPDNTIRLFTTGLTAAQNTALPIALTQWEAQAGFAVTRVASTADADVVITSAALSSNEDGYTSMHYVCASTCAYDHGDVKLTSTAALTKSSWVATILHELGHVAGLNHVARHSEVMYPEIDATSPGTYGAGDLAGFRELEKVRAT